MNTVITSREAILETCRSLIREKGWDAVNIRSVAAACGVSVGSIYNYYSSKSDLITATVASVWYDIFHIKDGGREYPGFCEYISWIYHCMEEGEKKYPDFFTLHTISLLEDEKEKDKGREMMNQAWDHMKKGLLFVLEQDPYIRNDIFDSVFTAEKLVNMVFSLILSSLLQKEYDCSALLEAIKRTLYYRNDSEK